MGKRSELHVSKLITEMPMLKMSHNSRLILYSVLKKIWRVFRSREDYIFKDVLTTEDIKEARKPVTLTLPELKHLFKNNSTYKDIKEHIKKLPLDAEFQTYYDLHGRKRDYLLDTRIALFTEIQFDDKKKEITFTPAMHLVNYIEALKSFAKIDIEEMKRLSGNYQIRGYELICQNNYLDKNNNKLIDDESRKIRIEDIRRYFEIPSTYNIGDIDRRVLNPLKRVINKHTKYNITDIKKFKLDSQNKCKVTHYRIDVEYKETYLKELKEKEDPKSIKLENIVSELCNYDNTFKKMKQQAKKI